ncbi:hypothetical protein FQN49_002177 [Arthroderma sp. PD_2]|nr:hypothetical protein FQN49_002177 [Arthroderma sp. PD_2]
MKAPMTIAALGLGFIAMVSSEVEQNQTDLSFCHWSRFRVGVIRDTVYMDGGELTWQRKYTDGSELLDSPGQEFNFMYTLSFNSSFDAGTNFIELFDKLPKFPGGNGNNVAPRYIDGTMFYNDYSLVTYGGLTPDPEGVPENVPIFGYDAYEYGPPQVGFEAGPRLLGIDEKTTPNVTHGAGVSVPNENKGYYFSGRQREDEGALDLLHRPNETFNSLVSVDLSAPDKPKFDTDPLEGITGRSNAELVWLPVSDGVLVAIGGVTYPESVLSGGLWPDQKKENAKKDPAYMETVDLYDTATGTWYSQKTSGPAPPASNSFCSVVAEAADRSSFNIYIYGGYNGTEHTAKPYDHVYILSIPSFTWIKVYPGESNMGRSGHKCVMPYPDKMLVIGGRFFADNICLQGPFVRVFNLNEMEFQDRYDPTEWSEYSVPDVITKEIGGNGKGGATKMGPEHWDNSTLEDIFKREYTKPIKKWFPFEPAKATPSPSPGEEKGGGGGLPKWVGAVLGVVLGLIFITALAVVWLILRRRRERRYAPSVGGTSEVARKRILGWMYGMGQPTHKPDMTTTSTEIGINDKHASTGIYSDSGMDSVASPHPPSTIVYSDINAPEAGSSPIHEMQAGTVMSPSELPTPFNDTPVRARHPSETPSFISPISPAISPSPENQRELHHPVRPTHGRHGSSFSSAGVPASLDNAIVSDNIESRPRDRRVSGFTEEFSDTNSPSRDDVELGHKI